MGVFIHILCVSYSSAFSDSSLYKLSCFEHSGNDISRSLVQLCSVVFPIMSVSMLHCMTKHFNFTLIHQKLHIIMLC